MAAEQAVMLERLQADMLLAEVLAQMSMVKTLHPTRRLALAVLASRTILMATTIIGLAVVVARPIKTALVVMGVLAEAALAPVVVAQALVALEAALQKTQVKMPQMQTKPLAVMVGQILARVAVVAVTMPRMCQILVAQVALE
jgi:hypothetical protein